MKKNNNEWQQIIDKLLKINPDERPDIDQVYKLIINLNFKNFTFDEKYLNSLDLLSQNIIKRNKPNKIVIIVKVEQKNISKKNLFFRK